MAPRAEPSWYGEAGIEARLLLPTSQSLLECVRARGVDRRVQPALGNQRTGGHRKMRLAITITQDNTVYSIATCPDRST